MSRNRSPAAAGHSAGSAHQPGLTTPQEAVLTTTTDTTPAPSHDDADMPDTRPAAEGQHDSGPRFTQRPMIPVALLTAHPGNVREDKQAGKAFCQSVAAAGIITPLEITTSPDHDGYVVVDGNIRLDAALKTGLDAVPYVFSPGTADDAGLQYLHMLISSRFRRDLSVHEEAAALFSASEAGMGKAEIRRATGLRPAEIRAGIDADALSSKTRERTEASSYAWTLEDLALLAPFDDDPDAMTRILQAIEYGQPLAYTVQKISDERADGARRAQLTADLRARGITVLDHAPEGAASLHMLQPGDPAPGDAGNPGSDQAGGGDQPGAREPSGESEGMDPAAHSSCPGAIAVLRPWYQEPSWYCLDPDKHGHARRQHVIVPPGRPDSGDSGADGPGGDVEPDPGRRLVIEGNKAWEAAGKVRHRWLGEFLARKSPPAGTGTLVPQFVTAQILAMPQPLRQALGGIRTAGIYQQLNGPAPDDAAGAAQARLWMLALAPIAAAYEDQMTATGMSRSTWRTDQRSSCPRGDAGAWLGFLAQAGYPLSPIEQAVAGGVPYQGDQHDARGQTGQDPAAPPLAA